MTGAVALPPLVELLYSRWGEGPLPAWPEIESIAGQHRLRPLLHDRAAAGGWDIPADLRGKWAAAHTRSGHRALRQRAELARLARRLGEAGIAAWVLKGGALVWRGWFDPALRPMRDLDLLLSPEDAAAAQALLRAGGYGETPGTSVDAKHLPGLLARGSGVLVELHTRLIDTPGPAWTAREAAWREAALREACAASPQTGGLAALSDTDTLLHVILHAVLDHQFNTGPLLLFDLSMLVRHGEIDWVRFWHSAALWGGERAAQLALRLAEAAIPGLAVDWFGHFPDNLDDETLAAAAALLLVDTERRSELGLAGRIVRLEPGARAGQVWAALRRGASAGGMAKLWRSAAGAAAVLAKPADRRHVGGSLAVARWLRTSA